MKYSMGVLLCVLWLVSPLWAATVTQIQGTETTWHNGTASLASGAQIQSANVTVTPTGYLSAWCNLSVPTFSVAPAANTAVVVWLRVSTDGTTFPDGGAAVTPAEAPHMAFPLRTVSTAQVVSAHLERLPPGVFQVLIRNDGTGATMNTTWSLKCRPYTVQVQ